jgi:spore germination cell wall hydrolase CwlJ-like protein
MTRHLVYIVVFLIVSLSMTEATIAEAPTLAMLGDAYGPLDAAPGGARASFSAADVPVGDTVTREQFNCLAQAIYFEARGEPIEGQVAVAQVVLNRLSDRRYPTTICGVVFQNETRRHHCQFSFACDGKSDRPHRGTAWIRAQYIASLAMNGQLKNVVGDSTHYHAIYSHPEWAQELAPTVVVGRHKFYADGSL